MRSTQSLEKCKKCNQKTSLVYNEGLCGEQVYSSTCFNCGYQFIKEERYLDKEDLEEFRKDFNYNPKTKKFNY